MGVKVFLQKLNFFQSVQVVSIFFVSLAASIKIEERSQNPVIEKYVDSFFFRSFSFPFSPCFSTYYLFSRSLVRSQSTFLLISHSSLHTLFLSHLLSLPMSEYTQSLCFVLSLCVIYLSITVSIT